MGARFEHRAWARRFAWLPDPAGAAPSREIYLLAPGLPGWNLKLREGALELKALEAEQGGLQRWRPADRLSLPAPAARLRALLAGPLPGLPVLPEDAGGSPEALVRVLPALCPGLRAVPVEKRRLPVEAGSCRAETVAVRLPDGASWHSAAAEHEDPLVLWNALRRLRLLAFANRDYTSALTRLCLMGLPPG
ncbi:hypothetical protein [Marinimicrococcus flavescens]|uniref:Uncharacterized protein n=1 Tax=Marinimicrococcus flavescens TaxID=3031815 RepID=A0AAP3V179_9PROT|nr:hypothetical protein [Marinimicrococcus flavescens]